MHVRWRTASAASLVYLSDAAYCAARSYVDKTRRAVARSASGRRVFLTRSPYRRQWVCRTSADHVYSLACGHGCHQYKLYASSQVGATPRDITGRMAKAWSRVARTKGG